MSDTGAQFIFPHLGHNKTVTIEESATLNVEFSIRSQCKSSLSLLSTINVERPSATAPHRVCQFVHVNGFCVLGTSECFCPGTSTGLYTLVKSVNRSHNGTWTFSSDPPLSSSNASVFDLGVNVLLLLLCVFWVFSCLFVFVCANTTDHLLPVFRWNYLYRRFAG